MNTLTAIDYLKHPQSADDNEIKEAVTLAIEALKKQIAEKPDVYSDGYADGYEVWEEHCPNCYYDFDGDNPSYCPRCGQKLSFEGLE